MKTGKAMGRLRRAARLAPLFLLLLVAAAWWWWGSIAETLGLGCHNVPWRQYCVDGDVGAMGWSPDGRKLAVSLGYDVEVLVLDLKSGRTLWHLPKVVFGPHSIAFTHDGKYVVTATADAERAFAGAALDLLDAETGRRVREVPGIYPHQSAQVNIGEKFAVSPDGKFLAVTSYHDLGETGDGLFHGDLAGGCAGSPTASIYLKRLRSARTAATWRSAMRAETSIFSILRAEHWSA